MTTPFTNFTKSRTAADAAELISKLLTLDKPEGVQQTVRSGEQKPNRARMAAKVFSCLVDVLDENGIPYEKATVAELVRDLFVQLPVHGEAKEEAAKKAEAEEPKTEVAISHDLPFIEIDGEQLTLSEIRMRMMRHADYTRKTQQLADERKQLQEAIEAAKPETDLALELRKEALDSIRAMASGSSRADPAWFEVAKYQFGSADYLAEKVKG